MSGTAVRLAGLLLVAVAAACGEPAPAPDPGERPTVTVAFVVRDGRTMKEMDNDLWTARLSPAPGTTAGMAALARPDGKIRRIAGPVPEGTYEITIEANGYLTLERTAEFLAGRNNRVDAALDPREQEP